MSPDLESTNEGRMLLYVGWDLVDSRAQTLTIHAYLSRDTQVTQVTAGHAIEKDGLTGPTGEKKAMLKSLKIEGRGSCLDNEIWLTQAV